MRKPTLRILLLSALLLAAACPVPAALADGLPDEPMPPPPAAPIDGGGPSVPDLVIVVVQNLLVSYPI
jgi:hypothetical protein